MVPEIRTRLTSLLLLVAHGKSLSSCGETFTFVSFTKLPFFKLSVICNARKMTEMNMFEGNTENCIVPSHDL